MTRPAFWIRPDGGVVRNFVPCRYAPTCVLPVHEPFSCRTSDGRWIAMYDELD